MVYAFSVFQDPGGGGAHSRSVRQQVRGRLARARAVSKGSRKASVKTVNMFESDCRCGLICSLPSAFLAGHFSAITSVRIIIGSRGQKLPLLRLFLLLVTGGRELHLPLLFLLVFKIDVIIIDVELLFDFLTILVVIDRGSLSSDVRKGSGLCSAGHFRLKQLSSLWF